MSFVGQKDTLTSPFLFLSVTKKYLMSRCLLCLLLDPFLFSASSIVLLLSWYILVVAVVFMPCPFRIFHVHGICPIASSIATNLASVELFVFSFCLHDVEYAAPFHSDMTILLWLHISGCMAYELSTHQFGCLPGSIVSIRSLEVCRYCITLVIFL